jgi:hypothetical protein
MPPPGLQLSPQSRHTACRLADTRPVGGVPLLREVCGGARLTHALSMVGDEIVTSSILSPLLKLPSDDELVAEGIAVRPRAARDESCFFSLPALIFPTLP